MNCTTIDAVVIGAGISGLATATWLQKYGLEVTVLESTNRPGGVMQSERRAGYLLECGPNSLLETSPRIRELIALAGLENQIVAANQQARRRYVIKNGGLVPLPMGPVAILRTPLLSAKAKWRLLREPFIPPLPAGREESVAAFVKRRLGEEFLDYAVEPFVAGVYAGDAEHLSLAAAFPKLKALEAKHGSLIRGAIRGRSERAQGKESAKSSAGMLSFREGLGQFTAALAENLAPKIRYGVSQTSVHRNAEGAHWYIRFQHNSAKHELAAQHVVITIPAHKLQDIAAAELAVACRALPSVPYAPIAIVATGYQRDAVARPLEGFGFLVPQVEGRQILGTLWNSTLFPGRAPRDRVLLTTFIGGARQPHLVTKSEEELIALTQMELQHLICARGEPEFVHVRKYTHAIPQYGFGHQRLQHALESIEHGFPGLHFAVNYRDGVSVSDCIVRAQRVAEKIGKDQHAPTRKCQPTVRLSGFSQNEIIKSGLSGTDLLKADLNVVELKAQKTK
ncbi:MAG: protoporphyrinogen oxidase [bacterium]